MRPSATIAPILEPSTPSSLTPNFRVATVLTSSAVGAYGQNIQEQALARLAGTVSIQAQPFFSEGRLVGCTLVFNALEQDFVYRRGAFIRIEGNIGIMTANGDIGTNLKVVVNEIDASMMPPRLTPSAPSRAYLIAPDLTTNLSSLVATAPSDTPGALFSVFQISPTVEMLFNALEMNSITIAFNSYGGSSDIRVKLELDVLDVNADTGERIRSRKMKDEFFACIGALVGK